jgi:hypothetical protein
MVLGPDLAGAEKSGGVTVNVGVSLTPGIVIRLPSDVAAPPLELEANDE